MEQSHKAEDLRPAQLGHARSIAILLVALSGQLMVQLQIGGAINCSAQFAAALGTHKPGEIAWIPASFSLTSGVFVLFFGRLGDIIGVKLLFVAGFVCNVIFNIVTGFVTSPIAHDVMRALAGVGAAATYVNSVTVLGRSFPLGHKLRVISFCLFGAMAPVGAYIGALSWALILEKAGWQWPFWSTACFCAIAAVAAFIILPKEKPMGGSMDWFGSVLGLSGMILFNFAWNQAPLAGWDTPYVYALLVVGVCLIVAFALWQKWVGDTALLPARMFHKKEVPIMLCAQSFGFMSFGIFLFYTTQFLRDHRGYTLPLSVAAQLTPLAPLGALAAVFLIWLLPRMKVHWIFALSMLAFFTANLLVSLAPVNQTYWAMIFPAAMILPAGPDLSYASSQLIISNSVSRKDQGSAGGICLTIVNYSISIGLGMAGTVERYVGNNGENSLLGTRAALCFGACLAFTALILVVAFVRIDHKLSHDGEDEAMTVDKVIGSV